MNIAIGARTDVGGRANNEDCLAVLDKDRAPLRADAVLIVADGMGGRANGEEASAIAVKVVRETLMDLLNPNSDAPLPPAEDALAAALRRANARVYELSKEHPDQQGMGTTCTAAILSEGLLSLAHVGDSRAYLLRGGVLTALTTDHTYVADQVRAGNMSEEAARRSKFRNVITRAIGIGPTVQPDFDTMTLQDADTVLLCTDGLTNALTEPAIQEILSLSDTAPALGGRLVNEAKAAGARDNVTAIVVRVSSDVLPTKTRREYPGDTDSLSALAGASSNGKATDYSPLTYHETAPEPQPSEKKAVPARPKTTHRVNLPSSGFRHLAAYLLAFVLGIAATFGILAAFGMMPVFKTTAGSPDPVNAARSAPTTSLPDLTTAAYNAPTAILYKPIRNDVLLWSGKDLLVINRATNLPMRVSTAGQIERTLAAPPIPVPSGTPGIAGDAQGNLYVSSPQSHAIKQFRPDGTFVRMLGAGGLTNPGALVVDPMGTIYVIDDGHLVILPLFSGVPSAPSPHAAVPAARPDAPSPPVPSGRK